MNFFNKISIFLLILSVFGTLAGLQAQPQTVKQLEAQRKKALQQIETTNKMLSETTRSQQNSENKIVLLNRNIREREQLITSINQEVEVLDTVMEQLDYEKTVLQNQLVAIKRDYVQMLQQTQENQSLQSKLMFVLSAENFTQTARRLRYLQEFANYRRQQAQKIEQITRDIELKNDSLSLYKNRQLNIMRQKTAETAQLAQDRQRENAIAAELNKKQKKLMQDIAAQQKKANDLNARIEKMIAEEIRRADAKRKAEAAKKAKTATSTTAAKTSAAKTAAAKSEEADYTALTAEETLLAGGFQKNQGRLPWPVDKGIIRGHFGVQPHPFLPHVTNNNLGIYIQTPTGTQARAVYEGAVIQRFSISGNNNTVMIQHGNYYTVYSNLTDIYVTLGQKVQAKQALGKIFTDDENDNRTELLFLVYKDQKRLDPELWLTK